MSLTRLHKYCELVTTSNGREEGEMVINTDTRSTKLTGEISGQTEQNNPNPSHLLNKLHETHL